MFEADLRGERVERGEAMNLSEHISECETLLAQHGDLEVFYLDGAEDAEHSYVPPETSLQSFGKGKHPFVMIAGKD